MSRERGTDLAVRSPRMPGMPHGRIETRTIWTSSDIPEGLSFPHVIQLVRIMREVIVDFGLFS